MHVEWYGQSSFALRDGDTTVFIDPFGDRSAAAAHGGGGPVAVVPAAPEP